MNKIENEILDELSPKYGKERVEGELKKHKRIIDAINPANEQIFNSVILFVMYAMFVLSYYYEFILFDINILRALPVTFFTYSLLEKFIINKYISNNKYYYSMLLLSLVNLYFAQKFDISIFMGLVFLPYVIVSKRVSIKKKNII